MRFDVDLVPSNMYGIEFNPDVVNICRKLGVRVADFSDCHVMGPIDKAMMYAESHFGLYVPPMPNTIFLFDHVRKKPEIANYVILHELGHCISFRLNFQPLVYSHDEVREEELRADLFALNLCDFINMQRNIEIVEMMNRRIAAYGRHANMYTNSRVKEAVEYVLSRRA